MATGTDAWDRVSRLEWPSDDELSATGSLELDFNLSDNNLAATIFDSRRTASTPDLLARVDVAFASPISFSNLDKEDRMSAALPAPFALLDVCMTFSRPVTIARMSLAVVILDRKIRYKKLDRKKCRYRFVRLIDGLRTKTQTSTSAERQIDGNT